MLTVATPWLFPTAVAVSVTCSALVTVVGAEYVTALGLMFVRVPQALPVQEVPVKGPRVQFTPLLEVALLERLKTATVKSTVCPWSIVWFVLGFGTTANCGLLPPQPARAINSVQRNAAMLLRRARPGRLPPFCLLNNIAMMLPSTINPAARAYSSRKLRTRIVPLVHSPLRKPRPTEVRRCWHALATCALNARKQTS